jgi:acyl-CoA synthetase (NDP forming)
MAFIFSHILVLPSSRVCLGSHSNDCLRYEAVQTGESLYLVKGPEWLMSVAYVLAFMSPCVHASLGYHWRNHYVV